MLNRRQESQGRFSRHAKSQKRIAALQQATGSVCETLEQRLLLTAIPQPIIPTAVFNVTSFSAVGNGTTVDTTFIQNAINAASAAGGGVVEIPFVANSANIYKTGPLTLASNINLEIDTGVTLQALPFSGPMGTVTYPGAGGSGAITPLITGHNISNFEITGFGTIDGQGAAWWTAFNANSSIARPSLIQLSNVDTVVLLNITLLNSPEQGVLFGASSGKAGNNVTINDVTVTAASNSPGTDGLDIAGTNFLLEGCSISVGGNVLSGAVGSRQNNVAIGGADIDISPQLVFCGNIDIEDCNAGSGEGITVGPQTTQGLNGLTINNCVFAGTTFGFRFISSRGNGGVVQNITVSNIQMTNVLNGIVVNDYYVGNTEETPNDPTTDPAQGLTANTPQWDKLAFSNVNSDTEDQFSTLGQFIGLAESPIVNVTFFTVTMDANSGFETDHVHGLSMDLDTNLVTFFDKDDTVLFLPQFYSTIDEQEVLIPDESDSAFDSQITINPMTVFNIGNPSSNGTSTYNTHYLDTNLSGTGSAFSGSSDQFTFDATPIYGNTDLTVNNVNFFAGGPTSGEAGIMIRESLMTNAAFIFVGLVNDGSGTTAVVSFRANDGGSVSTFSVPDSTPMGVLPKFEIKRVGTDFEVFSYVPHMGGSVFEQSEAISVNMTQASYMGTAVTSGDNSSIVAANFGGPIFVQPIGNPPAIITLTGIVYGATFTTPLTATPNPVTGTTALLSALAIESDVEQNDLGYTFVNTIAPNAQDLATVALGATPGTATATFPALGSYTFQVTAAGGLGSDTISTQVTVIQTATTINITPAPVAPDTNVEVEAGQVVQFSATALDQFGNAMAVQPTFTFSLGAGSSGSITINGLYTAGGADGTATIVATANGNSGSETVNVTNEAPTVAVAAAANPNPVVGTTANMSVLGADDGGEANLTYTWSATGPASVLFSINGTNAAKNAVATFSVAGHYMLTATITDAGGLTTTSTASVVVNQTPTHITVNPPTIVLVANAVKQFSVLATDQFGNSIVSPPAATWTLISGIGSITPGGRYFAPGSSGSAEVQATVGLLTADGTVLINTGPPSIVQVAAPATPVVMGHTASLSALGDDGAGESSLIYTWSSAGPAPVSFSANASNGSKNTVATFIKAGLYDFVCVISDPSGLTATTSVHVTVSQIVTAITISPTSETVAGNGHVQFAASGTDQFGNPMVRRPAFVWTLGDGSIGQISGTGRFTAPPAPGSATVTASVGAVSSAASTITVSVPGQIDPPTFNQVAETSASSTSGATVNLTAIGVDPLGATLKYRWIVSGPAPVRLSANNTAAAGNITATFHATGTYNFTVLIRGASGEYSATGVSVTVTPVVTTLKIMPVAARMLINKTRQFRAVARDQFNHIITNQVFTWSLGGGSVGSVNASTGLFSSLAAAGTASVEVAAGLLDATANVTVLA